MRWIWTLSARLRNVCRLDESLGLNVSQLVMYFATEVNRFLSISYTSTAIRKMPLKYWKPDAFEPMHPSPGVDDELQRDIV